MYTDLDDPLVTCPYEKAHQIRRSRMQIHIVKCRKNHPMAEMQICPFNATHIIAVPDYQYHLRTCPNKTIIEQQYYRLTDEVQSGEIKAAPFDIPEIDSEENWDTQVSAGYDPNLRDGPVPTFVAKQGVTKSEAKAFRLQHRLRIQEELAQQSDSRPSSAASTATSGSLSSPSAESTVRPREPKTRSLALQGIICSRPRDTVTSPDGLEVPDEVVASMGGLSLGRSLALQGIICSRPRKIAASPTEEVVPDEVVASMGGLSLGRPLGRGSLLVKRPMES